MDGFGAPHKSRHSGHEKKETGMKKLLSVMLVVLLGLGWSLMPGCERREPAPTEPVQEQPIEEEAEQAINAVEAHIHE